ncbi:MAG: Ni/Fe hydrogenase subunit alpha [Thermoleophilia bacterium]
MSAEQPPRTRTIRTDALTRVEGEGAMYVRIRDGEVETVQLRIYEPPRFFEALLRGRRHSEPPDITARICGICPVAYQLSACAALEDACGVEVPEPIALLRRLIYCGEWIESHGLHVAMLHAPDFLGYESAITMARDHGAVVERGLQIKRAGNAIVELVGGRAIHPVNVRLGGFYRAPTRRELAPLAEQLERAREMALDAVGWCGTLDIPDHEEDYEFVALTDPRRYAIEGGRLASSSGLDIAPAEFDEHVVEEQVPHSNALHARLRGGGSYLCGPLARYALGSERLSPLAREAARDAGLGPVCRNPFASIVVRSVEILYALDEALAIIAYYVEPEHSAVDVPPRAGTGHGWTEAPRGLLYHRYRLGEDGTILDARIVPPTSQNQRRIEQDLDAVVRANAELDDDALRLRCEQSIRNHDPCISCSTHFLDLTVDRA